MLFLLTICFPIVISTKLLKIKKGLCAYLQDIKKEESRNIALHSAGRLARKKAQRGRKGLPIYKGEENGSSS